MCVFVCARSLIVFCFVQSNDFVVDYCWKLLCTSNDSITKGCSEVSRHITVLKLVNSVFDI